jgi:hypothetical protein
VSPAPRSTNGVAAGSARGAVGTVDFRRFRTWDAEPSTVATPAWRIVARYEYVRLVSNWSGVALMILLVVVGVLVVGFASYGFAQGTSISGAALGGLAMTGFYPLAAILLLLGGPLLADDVRFNAPLFYFSKPLRVQDYFAGKVAFLASVVGWGVLLPVLLVLLMALVVGVPTAHPPEHYADPAHFTAAESAALVANWRASHVDTVGDWVAAASALVPGILVCAAFFVALAVAASAYTRRGWHAGMAFVAIVGGTAIAGGVLADAIEGAAAHLWSPVGWSYLILGLPLDMMFHVGRPLGEVTRFRGAGTAIPLAYVLMLAATGLLAWASLRRLRRLEGSL